MGVFRIVSAAVLLAGLNYGQVENGARIDGQHWLPIKANISPLVTIAEDRGEVEGSRLMPRMTIRFRMTPTQDRDLEQLLTEQQTRGNALYHQWLEPSDYAERFGVRERDAEAVAEWLREAGFTDIEVAPSRTSVSFSGSARQVEAALGTSIHSYVLRSEEHIGNAGPPGVPEAIAGLVESISGLHDFGPAPQHVRRTSAEGARPEFTDSSTDAHYLTPDDFATIYNVKPLYAAGIDGTGVKIAVAGESDIALSDIRSFRSAAGLPQKDPVVVLAGSDPGTKSGAETEADLDIEWAGGIAKNATIIYVNSTSAFTSASYAIEHNLAPILSISFGVCEAQMGTAELTSLANLFRQGNAQGITILASSGDTGAAACDAPTSTTATHGLAVLAPASIPYVTGVGGTTLLDGDEDFTANNNRGGGSARGYVSEEPWNDSQAYGTLEATGGGKSSVFSKPAWQMGADVPADGARDVPDVALAASPNRVAYLICSQGSCVSGFRSASGTLDLLGGTSCGPPGMAAIVALLDQMTGTAQGNINPELYALAGFAAVFNFVGQGDNEVPCTSGSPDCTNGYEGYTWGIGYGEVIGWGSVNAYALLNSWGEPAPVAIGAPPGGPPQVVAGSDTSLWALGFESGVYAYSAQTQSWALASSTTLTHLAVASSEDVWAVDFGGDVYRWNAGSQSFIQTPGSLSSIAVGGDGDAWGLNRFDAIFHFDSGTQTWMQIPGSLSSIAVGFDGAVWGINAYQQILRFNPGLGSFEYVPGALNNIAVSADGGVWGINAAANVYHFDRLTQRWDEFQTGGFAFSLAVGSETNVWSAGERYNATLKDFFNTGAFNIQNVTASADGSAWGEDDFGRIQELSPATMALNSWHQIPGTLVQLSAASDGNVWGVNMFGQIYTFDPLVQRWSWVPGTLAQIAVARDGAVWGVNPEGSVYRYDYANGNWDQAPGKMAQVSPADNGDVWALDAQSAAYRFEESAQTWVQVASSLRQLSVGADGAAWGIDAQGNVERFDGQSGSFVLQPGSMVQVSVGSSANVWALDAAGSIYRFDTPAGTWQQVPGQLSQVHVAYDGSVWGIDSQEQIWRFNAATQGWDNIPGALQSLSLGCDAVVWGMNSSGATYYFQ